MRRHERFLHNIGTNERSRLGIEFAYSLLHALLGDAVFESQRHIRIFGRGFVLVRRANMREAAQS